MQKYGIKWLVIFLCLDILKVYSEHDHYVLIMDEQIRWEADFPLKLKFREKNDNPHKCFPQWRITEETWMDMNSAVRKS